LVTAAVKKNKNYTLKIVHDDDAQSPREWDNLGKMMCWHRRYNFGDKNDFSNQHDFLVNLVYDNIPTKDIISFVKNGKASDLKLIYDNSAREWDLQAYNDYFKKWYTEYSTEAPLDIKDGVLADAILENMSTKNLITMIEEIAVIRPLHLYDHSIQSISMQSFIGRAHHANWDSGQVGWVYATHEDIKKEYGDISPASIDKALKLLNSEVETYDHYIKGEVYGFQLYDKKGEQIDSCWGFIGDFNDAKKAISEHLPKNAKQLAENASYGDDDTEHGGKPSILGQVIKNKELIKSQSNETNKTKIDLSLV